MKLSDWLLLKETECGLWAVGNELLLKLLIRTSGYMRLETLVRVKRRRNAAVICVTVRSEVFTVVTIKTTLFWDVALHILVDICSPFSDGNIYVWFIMREDFVPR
jgi:hypothetical protein